MTTSSFLASERYRLAKILAMLMLAAIIITSGGGDAADSKRISVPDLQTVELKILSADGRQQIGSTLLTVSSDRSNETKIKGETTYLDGQHDDEDARIQLVNGSLRLEKYKHSFFSADGRAIMRDSVDTKSRVATCARDEGGSIKIRTAEFDFPTDTFVGASQMLIVTAKLREGNRKIDFHAFACVPGPRLFYIHATVPERVEHWPYYHGDLVRLDLRPDLGAGLSLVIAPFLPKTEAWFDPQNKWTYVGGEFNRYFGGPHVLQVLLPSHRTQNGNS